MYGVEDRIVGNHGQLHLLLYCASVGIYYVSTFGQYLNSYAKFPELAKCGLTDLTLWDNFPF